MAVICGILHKSRLQPKAPTAVLSMTAALSETSLQQIVEIEQDNLQLRIFEHPNLIEDLVDCNFVKFGEEYFFGDVSIYNRDEIHREIEQGPSNNADSDLLLAAKFLTNSGAQNIKEIDGDFCLFRYSPQENSLDCYRDCIGHKSIFYAETDFGVCFSSIPQPLFAIPGFTPEFCPEHLVSQFCLGHPGRGNTLHKNVTEVPSGSTAKFAPGKTTTCRKYWQARPAVHRMAQVKPLQYLRDQIKGTVLRRVAGDQHSVGIGLSGGLDSNCILAMIKESNPKANVKAFSYVLGENANCELKDEKALISVALDHWSDIDWHSVDSSNLDIMGAGRLWNEWFLRPCTDVTFSAELALYHKIDEEKLKLVAHGMGGDDFVSSPGPVALTEFTRSLKFKNAIEQFVRLRARYPFANLLKFVLSRLVYPHFPKRFKVFMKKLRGRNWDYNFPLKLDELDQSYLINTLSENCFDPYGYEARSFYQLEMNNAKRLDLYSLPAYDFFANLHGFKHRYPLLSKSVIEAVLAIPIELKVGSTKDRMLIRSICGDLLPPEIAERDDKTMFCPDLNELLKMIKPQMLVNLNNINKSHPAAEIINFPDMEVSEIDEQDLLRLYEVSKFTETCASAIYE